MNYLDQTLTFESDKIYYNDSAYGGDREVMMGWEDSLMSASAAFVCQNGGDILEIGFGMGISAGYMHSHSINSHTIVENHPEIIPRAQAWASGKSNVNIVTGSWYDVRNNLSTYNGAFYDTFGDDDWDKFGIELPNLVKANAITASQIVKVQAISLINLLLVNIFSKSVIMTIVARINFTTVTSPRIRWNLL